MLCPWAGLPPGNILESMAHVAPEAMLTPLACDAAEGYECVHDSCSGRGPFDVCTTTGDHGDVGGR